MHFKWIYDPLSPQMQSVAKELGEKLSQRFLEFCKLYGRDLTLAFEPGKFLVSEAGFFLVKVNVVKQTTSTVFAGIDSGKIFIRGNTKYL